MLWIDISHSNEDDFLRNLLTVRVEERVAFAMYKPTGLRECDRAGHAVARSMNLSRRDIA